MTIMMTATDNEAGAQRADDRPLLGKRIAGRLLARMALAAAHERASPLWMRVRTRGPVRKRHADQAARGLWCWSASPMRQAAHLASVGSVGRMRPVSASR